MMWIIKIIVGIIVGVIMVGWILVHLVRALILPPDPRDTRGSDELDEAWRALSPKAREWIIETRKRERENERSTKND